MVDPAKVFTPQPRMGSEDFADMMQMVPGAYFWVGHDGSVSLHNPGFVFDDKISRSVPACSPASSKPVCR